jgi:hypothetical protein
MSEIVNLRIARKRAERATRELDAAENRAKHGMSKAERDKKEKEAAAVRATLDGAKREKP